MFKSTWSKVLGGFLLGTVGVPMLKSDCAKKVYTKLTTGAFIAKDLILEEAEVIQAMANDIACDAKVEVEKYYQEKDKKFEESLEEEVAENTEEAIEE